MHDSALEMIDDSLERINRLYEERSCWQRAKLMVSGLFAPRSTKAYKEARIEAQRFSAVIAAFLVPVFSVLCLAALTHGEANDDILSVEVEVIEEQPPEQELEQLTADSEPPPFEADATASAIQGVAMPVSQSMPAAEAVLAVASPVSLSVPVGLVRKSITIPGLGRTGLGSAFGSTNQIKGDLVGGLYDFKRDAKGNPRTPNYWEDLRRMVTGKLSDRAVRDFYKVPKNIYLSHLFVPYTKAETGPEAFGVGGLMEPKAWVAHYCGIIQPPSSGSYRFVGDFDDVLIVMIDGRIVLEVTWDTPGSVGGITGWKPTDYVDKHRCFTSRSLVYGDWVELKNTETRRIDVLVGERPGGMIGGVLLVEKQGANYEKESNGRPILPVLAVSLLSPQERDRLANHNGFAFDKKVLMMGVSGDGSARANALREDKDIQVFTGDL